MILKKELKKPILALFLVSFGGWFLHNRIHPISFNPDDPQNPANFIPFILGLLNVVIVPVLFNYKKTVIIAYLINGFSVIIGTIQMAHLSLSGLPQPLTLTNLMLNTTLANIHCIKIKLL
jgi:hypothetical protein